MLRTLKIFILVLFLCVSGAGLGFGVFDAEPVTGTGPDQSESSSRKTQEDITTFGGGADSAELDFQTGGGSNTGLNITMPKRAKVLSASVDVEGLTSLDMFDYDFTKQTNHTAYEGDVAKNPPGSAPSTYEKIKLDNTEIGNIKTEEGNMAYYNFGQGGTGNSTSSGRPYHMFKFKISAPNPSKFKIYWAGEGHARTGIGTSINEVYIYIYCPGNSTWVQVDYQTKTNAGNVKLTVNKEFTGAGSYVNPNGIVYIMAVGPFVNTALNKGYIATDYVKLTVYGGFANFPMSPTLDVGDDGDKEWSYSGELKTKVTIGDDGFKTELQDLIDKAGTDEGTFKIVFKFTAMSEGRLSVTNLNIKIEALEHNEPPGLVASELGEFYMMEDDLASGDNLIDLTICFNDDHDAVTALKYGVFAQEDPVNLNAAIDLDGYHVDFTPALDFSGSVMFRVSATDSGSDEEFGTFDDLITVSHYFNVTVNPINDAPVLEIANDKMSVNESDTLEFEVSAVDVDSSDFQWDSNLTDKVEITTAPEDSSKAKVKVTPGDDDVGKTIYFELKVIDDGGGQGNEFKIITTNSIEVHVINLNSPPRFVELTLLPDLYTEPVIPGKKVEFDHDDYSAMEDELYEISITADDPDIGIDPNEKLTFSLIPPEDLAGTIEIDPDIGIILLTPLNADVGTVEFKIIVTDNLGESAELVVAVRVLNTNDPPKDVRIIKPTDTEFTTDDLINFAGECTDDDLNVLDSEELLTYMWFTNKSAEPLGMGSELFGRRLTEGVHEITLKVIDAKGETMSTSITLEVKAVVIPTDPSGSGNEDPTGDPTGDDDPLAKKVVDDKKAGNTDMIVLAVVVVVIIAVVVALGIVLKKKKKVEEDDERAGQPQVPGFPGMMGVQQYPGMYQTPTGQMMQFSAPQQMGMPYGVNGFGQPAFQMQQPSGFAALPGQVGTQAEQVPQQQFSQPAQPVAQPATDNTQAAAPFTDTGAITVTAHIPSASDLQGINKNELQSTKPVR